MTDYRGLLIKEERKKMDISLEALSHGICSPSYLSKIENNIVIANDAIYDLLFKKLGIQIINPTEEKKIKNLLDLFFKYYMSSNLKILKVVEELLEYKNQVSSSYLFVQYQLFLLYASEMNSQISITIKQVEVYFPYMNDQQRELFNLFKLSFGDVKLSNNDEWVSIRTIKAKANLHLYQKNIFKAYDLYKTGLSYAIELGNKSLIAEFLCSLGWLCLEIDLDQAERYYSSAVSYDSQYKMLAYYNLGATMIQNKRYLERGNRYLLKGLKSCSNEFMKQKYKEVLFICEILKENKKEAEKILKELSKSKYYNIFSIMLNDNYQLNSNYQRYLKDLKDTSSLFRFLFIKNCELQHKYKDICVVKNFI